MSVPHPLEYFSVNSGECMRMEVSTDWLSFVFLKERQCQITRCLSRPRQGTTPPLRTCRCLCPERNRDPSSPKPGRRTAWWVTETISFCPCDRQWSDYCCKISWSSFPALHSLQLMQLFLLLCYPNHITVEQHRRLLIFCAFSLSPTMTSEPVDTGQPSC